MHSPIWAMAADRRTLTDAPPPEMELTLGEAAEAVGGSFSGGTTLTIRPTGVSIDSRTVRQGDLFFAIGGPRFDGHDFVDAAFTAGAAGAVVLAERAGQWRAGSVLAVKDTVDALAKLASYYRDKLSCAVVAVTGSNGKTSTKDLVAHVLAGTCLVGGTQGNLNNYLGVPLTLLSLRSKHEAAVVEMGASKRGEIAYLAGLAKPRIGVITNVGPTHLEEMGSIEAVAAAKAELASALPRHGALIVNGDDSLLLGAVSAIARNDLRVVKCGFGPGCDVRADSCVSLGDEGMRFETAELGTATVPTLGRHSVYNALMAFAVGRELGLDPDAIRGRLSSFRPPSLRLQLLRLGDLTVLNDCYNSNPASAVAALRTLGEYPARGRRVAVLGDMLELGGESARLHGELGREAAAVDWLLTTGIWAGEIAAAAVAGGLDPEDAQVCTDMAALIAALMDGLRPGDVVLVKASRAIGMEQVAQALEGRFPKGS